MVTVNIFCTHWMCTATEQMCCTLDRGAGGGRDAFQRSNVPRCSLFVSKQTYWSLPCHLIRVNLVGWVRQLLRWKLSHQFKDGRWRGGYLCGPSMRSTNLLCLASPGIYKWDRVQAAQVLFLPFVQGMMFWCSSRKQNRTKRTPFA